MKELFLKLKLDNPNNVGIIRRFISYMMDWYIGGMFTSLPLILTYTAMNSGNVGLIEQNINIFQYPLNIIIGFISFMAAAFYYVYVPVRNGGQTLGKRIMKIRIVDNDYSAATKKQIFMRQFVIILLLEGSMYTSSNMLHQILNEITSGNIVRIYNYLGIAVTILSAVIIVLFKSRRALHDIITGTRVICEKSTKVELA